MIIAVNAAPAAADTVHIEAEADADAAVASTIN